MEACIDFLQPKGNVLEIGFGMGYSATAIQKYNPKSYTIIECDPIVIKKCKEWAKNYNNVTIIEAKWQEVICTDRLKIYDEIFFDDFPNDINELPPIQKFQINNRVNLFIDFINNYHSKSGSKISALWKSKYIDNENFTYKEKIIDINVSNIQKYHLSTNKAIIPLIIKN